MAQDDDEDDYQPVHDNDAHALLAVGISKLIERQIHPGAKAWVDRFTPDNKPSDGIDLATLQWHECAMVEVLAKYVTPESMEQIRASGFSDILRVIFTVGWRAHDDWANGRVKIPAVNVPWSIADD